MIIRLGEHDRGTGDETMMTKDFDVDLILPYPEFGRPSSHSNDITLMRLTEAADLAVYTPACLPATNQDFTGRLATVAGWGRTKPNKTTKPLILQELEGLKVQEKSRLCSHWSRD